MKNIILSAILLCTLGAAAQAPPLYIVNGRETEDLRDVDPDDIVSTELLPADERTVELYGPQANNGVIVVSLRYDSPARFEADSVSFARYVSSRVKWDETERTARFVVRFTVETDGSVALGNELESTDPRLRRKVLRALSAAPRWTPATKDGKPVRSSHVLRIQLPEGRPMPPERAIILL
ncbi:MAG: energy transducer TonB [Alistipes sp.]|nr:energy transducer TonB [Alistipes sp.]